MPKGGDLIKVRFTRAFLPDAEACFNTIKLPRHHQDYLSFRKAMNVAVNCQNQGYTPYSKMVTARDDLGRVA